MSSLFGAMTIAMGAMAADQAEVQNSANNIANSGTPGYARRRVVLEEKAPLSDALYSMGAGVNIAGVQSLRDALLGGRIQQETQQQAASQEVVNSMQPVQSLFSGTNGNISDSLNAFFNSLQQLSTSPSDLSFRSAVLTSANNLASAFRSTASELSDVQANLDLGVVQSVNQINQLTEQLAKINTEANAAQNSGQSANALEDQRQSLMSQLSSLIDFSVTDSSDGPTITAADGSPLVVGGKSFALSNAVDSSTGFQDVISAQGIDITNQINAGQLGGILQVRDGQIAGVLSDLNTLATNFANAVNTAHSAGYDLNGNAGGALFSVSPGAGAAASISVAIQDPQQIAASLDSSSGGNGNVLAMINVGQEPVVDSQTATQFVSGMVFRVGNDVAQAQSESDAGSLMLKQLQDEQGAVSGVSIDEEAANLLTYQQAYAASARVVTVVNDLSEIAINLGASGVTNAG